MSRFSPLEFQKEAIQKLRDSFQRLWQRSENQRHLVFKSPTGSVVELNFIKYLEQKEKTLEW